ncbi:hypothetical protein H6504_00635 [Candidatus Woesearchaeota archaeon]|nr:hypothetical protein [Candidatus Woesearchaeota archaeon]
MKLEGTVAGFYNPNRFFPSPVIAIYASGVQLYARYPSGDSLILAQFEDMIDKNHFIPSSLGLYLTNDASAFAFSVDDVVVGDDQFIRESIERRLHDGRSTAKYTYMLEKSLEMYL